MDDQDYSGEESDDGQVVKRCSACTLEHRSIYDKRCPVYIPVEQRATTSYVIVSLVGRLRDKRCLPYIQAACDAFHNLRYLTSLVILAPAVRTMEGRLQPPEINEEYYRTV